MQIVVKNNSYGLISFFSNSKIDLETTNHPNISIHIQFTSQNNLWSK